MKASTKPQSESSAPFFTLASVMTLAFSLFYSNSSAHAQPLTEREVPRFCIQHQLAERLEANRNYLQISPSSIADLTRNELLGGNNILITQKEKWLPMWDFQSLPLLPLRRLISASALNDIHQRLMETVTCASGLNREQWINELKHPSGKTLFNCPSESIVSSAWQSRDDKNSEEQGKSTLASMELCRHFNLSIFEINSCIQELKAQITRFKPLNVGNTKIAAIPILKSYLQNPIHSRVLGPLAYKMITAFPTASSDDHDGHDLYSDILSEYLNEVRNEKLATTLTNELFTVFGLRGENFSLLMQFAPKENQLALIAPEIIFTIASKLNALRVIHKRPLYTLPKGVASQCDTGKVYHFWLPALIANEITNRTGNPKVAQAVAYSLSLGYQMRSNAKDRSAETIFTHSTFAPNSQKVRMDLAYASAGAMYGSRLRSNFSLDKILVGLVNRSQNIQPLNKAESANAWAGSGASGYFRFVRMFAVFSPFAD